MREIVKLAVVAAVIVIAGALIALFASGYISAFKPGGTNETAGEHIVGGGGSSITGGVSVASTPAPSPSPLPMPMGMPEGMPMPPVQQMPPGSQPIQPVQPMQMPDGPFPDPRMIQDRQEMPPFVGPAVSPLPSDEPQEPPFSWSPDEMGWMQLVLRIVGVLPVLFPGLSPWFTWWPQSG